MSISDNIKKYRKEKKLTQKQLGDMIEKKEITIRRYEKGDIIPPIPVIEDIAKALDCQYADIAISEEDWKRFSDWSDKEEMVKSINNITYKKDMYITPNYIQMFEDDKTFDGVTIKYKDKVFTLTSMEYYKLADKIIESVVMNVLAAKAEKEY